MCGTTPYTKKLRVQIFFNEFKTLFKFGNGNRQDKPGRVWETFNALSTVKDIAVNVWETPSRETNDYKTTGLNRENTWIVSKNGENRTFKKAQLLIYDCIKN